MNEFRAGSMNPPTASSWSAEEDAERLMDDVFSDIDSLFAGKKPTAKVPTTSQADYTALQSLVIPPINLEGAGFDEPTEEVQIVEKKGWGYYSERLLFLGSCASLLGVVLWMAVNDRLRVPLFLSPSAPVAEVVGDDGAIAEPIFSDYVRRALDNIDRKGSTPPIPPQGQQAVPGTDQNPNGSQNPSVIERIYIPVYPPDVAANGQSQPVMPPSSVTLQPPKPVAPVQPNIPTPPQVLPQPPAPDVLNSLLPAIPAPPAAQKDVYTLVGVLEAGDRSAALFSIGGNTQRFKVGESIGASNWKIISIQNQQILVGQGGQTTTLFVGQTFSF